MIIIITSDRLSFVEISEIFSTCLCEIWIHMMYSYARRQKKTAYTKPNFICIILPSLIYNQGRGITNFGMSQTLTSVMRSFHTFNYMHFVRRIMQRPDIKEIVMWSDGCGYQHRNANVFSELSKKHAVMITQKYLVAVTLKWNTTECTEPLNGGC